MFAQKKLLVKLFLAKLGFTRGKVVRIYLREGGRINLVVQKFVDQTKKTILFQKVLVGEAKKIRYD